MQEVNKKLEREYLMSRTLPITIPKEKLAEFCQQNYIRKLSLFGSVLRDDFTSESDVDFLVEFLPDVRVTYCDLVRMERELSGILNGKKVDLRTPAELSRYFRQEVLDTALVQYDQNWRSYPFKPYAPGSNWGIGIYSGM